MADLPVLVPFRYRWRNGIGSRPLAGNRRFAFHGRSLIRGIVRQGLRPGFLGRPRSQSAELADEPSSGTVSAQVLLSIPCLALGVLAPAVLRLLEPVGGAIVPGYNSAGIFTLPQPQLMLAMAELTVLIYALVLSGKSARVKRYVTWDCGYGPLPVRTLINPTSYSLPLANLFRPILQHKITSQIKGRDRRHFPDSIKIEEENIPLLTKLVYMPPCEQSKRQAEG